MRPSVCLAILLALTLDLRAGWPSAVAQGNLVTVKGTVRMADPGGRRYQGYWRLENGTVPVKPAAGGKPSTVVVLDGINGSHAPPPRTVTVEIANLDAQPRVVVVGPGSVVEFKNMGKTTHELSTPADPSLMPIERLNPETFRRQKFGTPGGYLVRCAEYPHLTISVIVVDSPYYAIADERGAFSIPSVPEGKARLRVWSQGHFAHEQTIDTASQQELAIKAGAAAGSKDREAQEGEARDTEGKDNEGRDEGRDKEGKSNEPRESETTGAAPATGPGSGGH